MPLLSRIFARIEAAWGLALVLLIVTGIFRMLHEQGHATVAAAPDGLVDFMAVVSLCAFAAFAIALVLPITRALHRPLKRWRSDKTPQDRSSMK